MTSPFQQRLRITVCLVCLISVNTARELVFVQAIWRHGDRAPLSHPYPKDPYDESAWPRGWQQLTNIGMQQLNELGNYFRQTYNTFVRPNHVPSEVYILSSDSDRALTSAQAFISGFYPAQDNFQWQNGNSWQPIPVHASSPGANDILLKPTSTDCKNYDALAEADDAKEAAVYNVQYANLFKFLEGQTGIANFSYVNINKVYDINRELINNLTDKQPAWVFQNWPDYGNRTTMEIVNELRRIRMMTKFNSPEKSKMIGGYLLNNFIQNALKVANGTMKKPNKMLLYSSHDGTVLSLMYAMDVANELMVPYAAAVIMEIYKEDSDYLVEFLYRNETTHPPYRLAVPKCGTRCTVQTMAEQYLSMTLVSLGQQQQLCGTPLKECNSSSSVHSILFTAVLLMVMSFL